MRPVLAALLLGLAGLGPAGAVERLTGEAIRSLFEGNTVGGRYSEGPPFSEYHHPDGRVSGHNRHIPNVDACWTTIPDGVCYYYGPRERRRTYCFDVDRSDRLLVLRSRPSGRINGLAAVERGDPHGHGASATAWTCDGLISRAPDRARLMAGR